MNAGKRLLTNIYKKSDNKEKGKKKTEAFATSGCGKFNV